MSDDEKPKCCLGDEIVLGPDLGKGLRPAIRHTADHKIEAGIIREVVDGETLPKDAMFIERIEDNRYKCSPVLESHEGPTRATSPAYRSGWDRIFRGPASLAN